MNVEQITEKYKLLEGKLLYQEAIELLKLITNEEYEKILISHKNVFTKIANISSRDTNKLKDYDTQILFKKAIYIFCTTIRNRKLTKEQFDKMSFNESIIYLNGLVKNLKEKDDRLYTLINILETNVSGNSKDSYRVSLS